MNLKAFDNLNCLHPKIMNIMAYANAAVVFSGLGAVIYLFGAESSMLQITLSITVLHSAFFAISCLIFLRQYAGGLTDSDAKTFLISGLSWPLSVTLLLSFAHVAAPKPVGAFAGVIYGLLCLAMVATNFAAVLPAYLMHKSRTSS